MRDKKILFKTPQYEIEFEDLCNRQFKQIVSIMGLIEKEFNTSMHKHPNLRHKILDISNFINRLPDYLSEVVEVNKNEDKK